MWGEGGGFRGYLWVSIGLWYDVPLPRKVKGAKVAESIATRLGSGNFGRIARRTGYTKQHVSRACQGKREPSLDVAKHLADAAGVTLDQFYTYTSGFRKVKLLPKDVKRAEAGL